MHAPLITRTLSIYLAASAVGALALEGPSRAQVPQQPPGAPGRVGFSFGPPPGIGATELKLVQKFDRNGDGWLNQAERKDARQAARQEGANRPGLRFGPPGGVGFGPQGPGGAGGFGGRGFRPPGMFGMNRLPATPGPRVSASQVQNYPDRDLYDPSILRTVFLDFENSDWEEELADFRPTDVEVPATLTVDGKRFANVGVRFRGASSYFMTPAGYKRSLNVSIDLADPKARLYGYKTLNLLNSNGDPGYLSSILYSEFARSLQLPAPRANLVRVVINGERWGIYVNVQQFDGQFLKEHFKDASGVRWKVPGHPGGGGGLAYVGENVEDYKHLYEIKTNDPKKQAEGWKRLITLCRTLEQTPPQRLEAALTPMLDIESALRYLALDTAVLNSDGYWIRASDFNMYTDASGVFHIIPHDMNEAFRPGGGPDFGRGFGQRGRGGSGGSGGFGPGGAGGFGPGDPGGPGGRGVEVDPMIGADDPRKPLLSKLLAVPALKARYLHYLRQIATQDLNWNQIRPLVERHRALLEREIAADTRKLDTLEAFEQALGLSASAAGGPQQDPRVRGPMSIREFVEKRSAYLLSLPAVRDAR